MLSRGEVGTEILNTVFNEEGLGFQLSHTLRKIQRDLEGKKKFPLLR